MRARYPDTEDFARFPALRDRSVFVGNPDDVVPHGFGDGLPAIRDWVQQNYRFSGYVSGFEPDTPADRDAIRAELGYRPGEQVCVVTVGGSGVGTHVLRRAVAAYPAAKALVPGLRMVVVTGPRIEPDSLTSLPAADGLEVRTELPREAPSGPVRRGPLPGLRPDRPRGPGAGRRGRDRPPGQLPPGRGRRCRPGRPARRARS